MKRHGASPQTIAECDCPTPETCAEFGCRFASAPPKVDLFEAIEAWENQQHRRNWDWLAWLALVGGVAVIGVIIYSMI